MQTENTILGVDAGGTFTDFVCMQFAREVGAWNIRIHKTLSTPAAPEQAILQGIESLGLQQALQQGRLQIIHGSTVATNAALEGNMARTAFITNYGFGDLLTLSRQTRPKLYALEFSPLPPPVPSHLCLETGGRLAADGEVLEALSAEELDALVANLQELKPDAIAINLLFSFLDDEFEQAIEQAIRAAGIPAFISRSSSVLPVYKEYERGIATWLNAALGPVVQGYLTRLQEQTGECSLQIMQSSGETIAAEKAAEAAVHLLLSGPAGGITAIDFLGKQTAEPKIISFDMGGTSTDVALLDGEIGITSDGSIGRYPVAVPAVDMHTIGAGGGSIAFVDSGGMLQVGPRSAGAAPGPACYGQGGEQATVTDANLVLGRLVADVQLADGLQLKPELAKQAIASLADKIAMTVEETALGIVNIANEHMARAIREISVNRGHDPKDFVLASFGGAGGLHVCALAEAMQMHRAIVPARGGVLSALGMLVARRGRQFARTVGVESHAITEAELDQQFQEIETEGQQELMAEGLQQSELLSERRADIRYLGQSYTLKLPWHSLSDAVQAFHRLHKQRYGYALEADTEIVNLCVHMVSTGHQFELPGIDNSHPAQDADCNNPQHCRVYGVAEAARLVDRAQMVSGESIAGPAIITEYAATTYVAPPWCVCLDEWGNLVLSRTAAEQQRQ